MQPNRRRLLLLLAVSLPTLVAIGMIAAFLTKPIKFQWDVAVRVRVTQDASLADSSTHAEYVAEHWDAEPKVAGSVNEGDGVPLRGLVDGVGGGGANSAPIAASAIGNDAPSATPSAGARTPASGASVINPNTGPTEVTVTRGTKTARPSAPALPAASAAASHVKSPSPVWSAPYDLDAPVRCLADRGDFQPLSRAACVSITLSLAEMRADASDPGTIVAVVNATTYASGNARAAEGLLLLGRLACAENCGVARDAGPNGSTVNVHTYSRDLCGGAYALAFQGLDYADASARWSLVVRIEFANYEHRATPRDNCTRHIPGAPAPVVDGARYGCGPIRRHMGDGLLYSGTLPSRQSPVPTPDAPAQEPSRTQQVALNDGGAPSTLLPSCGERGESASDDETLPGRWVLRPGGDFNMRLCRGGDAPVTDMWTCDRIVWCPRTCRLRLYSPAEIATCFERRSIKSVLLVGDSRTRNLFDEIGSRLVNGRAPMIQRCALTPVDPREWCRVGDRFVAHGASFEHIYAWGFFPDANETAIPRPCSHELGLNYTAYFASRRQLRRDGGLESLRERMHGESAKPYDVVLFTEGVHALQPFLLDEDTLAFVRSAAEIIATAPSKPPVVIYQTAPAVVDFGNGVRDNARIAALNARAIKAVRDVLPGVLVLDLFAMTVDVARTRYADPTHFSVRVPSNAFKESDPPPPIIGSEAVLVLLHLLCAGAEQDT